MNRRDEETTNRENKNTTTDEIWGKKLARKSVSTLTGAITLIMFLQPVPSPHQLQMCA